MQGFIFPLIDSFKLVSRINIFHAALVLSSSLCPTLIIFILKLQFWRRNYQHIQDWSRTFIIIQNWSSSFTSLQFSLQIFRKLSLNSQTCESSLIAPLLLLIDQMQSVWSLISSNQLQYSFKNALFHANCIQVHLSRGFTYN